MQTTNPISSLSTAGTSSGNLGRYPRIRFFVVVYSTHSGLNFFFFLIGLKQPLRHHASTSTPPNDANAWRHCCESWVKRKEIAFSFDERISITFAHFYSWAIYYGKQKDLHNCLTGNVALRLRLLSTSSVFWQYILATSASVFVVFRPGDLENQEDEAIRMIIQVVIIFFFSMLA